MGTGKDPTVWGYTIDPRHAVSRVCAISGTRRRFSASTVPWRRRQTVAGKGNEGAVARTALAAPPKEDAETFADPSARFQGRSRTRSLEAGHHRPFPNSKDLSGLSLVGRSRPKLHQGDRQTPEGFYTITPKLINPKSNFYLAIDTGFPNAFDKANDRDGNFLMIHGDCSSSGCYAMTDEQIGEIYSLARDSLIGGHPSFQVQAYPFRMTPANLARHRTNPHMAFWKMLKIGNDHFEATHLQPKVDVCDRRYVFDAQPPPSSSQPLVFDPNDQCPAFVVNPKIARAAVAKQHADEVEYAQLVKDNLSVAPIYSGLDGGMNTVFHAQFPGKMVPLAIVLPPGAGFELAELPPVPWTDKDGSLANKFFGGLIGYPAQDTQHASAASTTRERATDSAPTTPTAVPTITLASARNPAIRPFEAQSL